MEVQKNPGTIGGQDEAEEVDMDLIVCNGFRFSQNY